MQKKIDIILNPPVKYVFGKDMHHYVSLVLAAQHAPQIWKLASSEMEDIVGLVSSSIVVFNDTDYNCLI